jgi:hypothetical protein
MNFGIITPPSAAQTQIVQSADPTDLQNLVNAAIGTIDRVTNAITSITLAGAGDGHTFVVLIESAPLANVTGGISGSGVAPPLLISQVRCYLASTAEELETAKTAAGAPAALPLPPLDVPFPYSVLDEQVAGSSKGTRFMGMTVFALSLIPVPVNSPAAQVQLSGVLGGGADPVVMAIQIQKGFSLPVVIPADTVLQYDGNAAIETLVDVSVVVQLTAAPVYPAGVTVEVLQDPAGAGTILASQSFQIFSATDNEEAAAMPTLCTLGPVALVPGTAQIGIKVTTIAPVTGTVTGLLRVAAR